LIYNNFCALPASPISINGPVTRNFSFADSCRAQGIYGNVNYTGTKGFVDSCNPIYVFLFSDAAYTTIVGALVLPVNNVRYDIATQLYLGIPNGTTLYELVYYSWNNFVSSGNPYIKVGAITVGANPVNVAFNDATIFP
jgi:hypothetical protein